MAGAGEREKLELDICLEGPRRPPGLSLPLMNADRRGSRRKAGTRRSRTVRTGAKRRVAGPTPLRRVARSSRSGLGRVFGGDKGEKAHSQRKAVDRATRWPGHPSGAWVTPEASCFSEEDDRSAKPVQWAAARPPSESFHQSSALQGAKQSRGWPPPHPRSRLKDNKTRRSSPNR